MTDALFLKGLILGFSIAAPVGPVGILCIQRTLNSGQFYGLVSGLGAATADAVYGLIAASGLTLITSFLATQGNLLRFVGGLFLGYLGVKTFLTTVAIHSKSCSKKPLAAAYISTFLLTLTNPMTILSFTVIFAGLGLTEAERGYPAATLLVLGVFVGSGLWWLLLSSSVGMFRGRLNAPRLRWVNRGSGVIMAGFSLVILFGLLGEFV